MGNLQTADGNKTAKGGVRTKMRLLGGRKGGKPDEWTSITPQENERVVQEVLTKATDNGEASKTTPSAMSSSESNFTLALTPATFNSEPPPTNENYVQLAHLDKSSPFSEDLQPTPELPFSIKGNNDIGAFNDVFQPLNNFKLNEFRARLDQEKVFKLNKLGVTRISQISLEGDGSGFSSGVVELQEEKNKDEEQCKDDQNDETIKGATPLYRRHMSVPLDVGTFPEGAALQKATSLSRADLEARLQRPKFVPEKLDFRLYEKFEGHMLVNWYLSELNSDSPARAHLGLAELKLLAAQFCTHLLAARVLRQLPDPGVPPTNIFRPDCIYFWSHAEAPASQPQTPGRLSGVFWPPASPSEILPSPIKEPDITGSLRTKNSARDVEILALEEEIRSLRQEVEKHKTLIEIQNLTASAVQDFGSPTEKSKSYCEAAILAAPECLESCTQTDVVRTHICVQTEYVRKNEDKETQTDDFAKNPSEGSILCPITTTSLPAAIVSPTPPPPPPPPPPPLSASFQPPPPPPPPPPVSSFQPPPIPCFQPPPPPPPPPGCSGIPLPPPGQFPPPPPPSPGMPPLPPSGPMPMPAPPPGGFNPQKAAMKKPPVIPPVPMKPLYWTRILVAQAGHPEDEAPLWNEIEEVPIETLPDFTELFSRQVVNRAPTIKRPVQKPKVEVVKLLDSKRSQSVGILAQSLRQDFNEIENAIYSFDTSVVNLEALQQIYEVRATAEELTAINDHIKSRPDVPLDKPEQFLFDLSQIADFAERIACLTFQVEFEDGVTTIGHTLDNFSSTCDFLTKNVQLKRVLALVLTVGNYMNGGNVARGQADGFGLEVLPRLRDVKGTQAGVTLLHYVVGAYARGVETEGGHAPPLPVPEPGDVRRAMALDFDSLRGELTRLKKKLTECENKTDKIIENSTPENLQPFKEKMTVFLEKSRSQLDTECDSLEECHKQFMATMKMFLFKPKGGVLETFAPAGFFELWLPFCVDFKDIFKKEVICIEKERAQELKRKEYRVSNSTTEREHGLKAKFKQAQARLKVKQVQETTNS